MALTGTYKCAIVLHNGTGTSDHYTCIVRKGGAWFRCNDDTISAIVDIQVDLDAAAEHISGLIYTT